ncbi:MAG: Hsp20/alpha crystallin family protein [Bacteroidota bacterium]
MKLARINNGLFPNFVDDFFNDDVMNWFSDSNMNRATTPAVNVQEENDKYLVEVAAPGMKKDDFNVELENNVLTISSERKEEKSDKDKKGNYTRREFNYHAFRRSFSLPENEINADKIKAKYEDGVLRLVLPKREEAYVKKSRQIEIG